MGSNVSVSDGSWDHIDASFVQPILVSHNLWLFQSVARHMSSAIEHHTALHHLHKPIALHLPGHSSAVSNRNFRLSSNSCPLPRPDPPAGSYAPRHSDVPLARPIAQSPAISSLKRPALPDSVSFESILSPEPPKIQRIHNAPSELSPALPGLKRSSNTQMIQVRQCKNGLVCFAEWAIVLKSGSYYKNHLNGRNMQDGFWMDLHRARLSNTFQLV